MLTALESGVKGGKWFSLIDKVHSARALKAAWGKVKANKGSAGIDKISIERFSHDEDKYLKELQESIRTGEYKPEPVKRVMIPKDKNKKRPLGIPTVKDRIAQAAVKQALEPILEIEFQPNSFGFRPGRGAKDALRKVDTLLKEGYIWVVDADIQSYFDTIPHDKLMERLERYISDSKLLVLIESWLKQDIIKGCERWTPMKGSPQGAVLSPLLANLYLNDFDIEMCKQGFEMVRYADDSVILTKSQEEAEQALEAMKTWMTTNGLEIHPEKTTIGNYLVEGNSFQFLGYIFECGKKWIRQASIQKFRDKVRSLTKRTCGKSMEEVIVRLNKTLKGWYMYFKHVNKWGMGTFDGFVRRRLRAILRKRERRPGFGMNLENHRKWPNTFFANLGLFTMENARVLEIACRSRRGNC
jgi:RNA-directed DNA polymerase